MLKLKPYHALHARSHQAESECEWEQEWDRFRLKHPMGLYINLDWICAFFLFLQGDQLIRPAMISTAKLKSLDFYRSVPNSCLDYIFHVKGSSLFNFMVSSDFRYHNRTQFPFLICLSCQHTFIVFYGFLFRMHLMITF